MATTAALNAAVATGNVSAVGQCLTAFMQRTVSYASSTERQAAVDAIADALRAFPKHVGLVAGALGAMTHASLCVTEAAIPVHIVLNAVKPHEKTLLVVQAASRLMSFHVSSLQVQERLPELAEAAARWLTLFPSDPDVAYYAAITLVTVAAQEPTGTIQAHGKVGADSIAASVVKGATAAHQHVEYRIEAVPWNEWIIARLFRRLRA
jgi:hypothetical protein